VGGSGIDYVERTFNFLTKKFYLISSDDVVRKEQAALETRYIYIEK